MTQRIQVSWQRAAGRSHAERGFMLIEALVALLIFAFGVLGIVGLQASMTKAQTQSRFRADASLLAQRLIGTMWSDKDTLVNYTTANCASHSRCSEWDAHVAAALPVSATTVAVAALPGGTLPNGKVIAADVTITINWTPPNEQQHTYTTTSAVAVNPP